MAQEERKAKAVLRAAVEWTLAVPGEMILRAQELRKAVEEYRETKSEEPPADPMAWRCPHCDAERPPFGWHYNLGDTGPFALQWVTCFCGECKKMLGVTVVAFMPKPELAEQLKAQFAGKIGLV
jgi:hypothetical protein